MVSPPGLLCVLLHFVLTQCRSIIVFYISFKSYLALSVKWNFTRFVLDPETEVEIRRLQAGPSGMMPLRDFDDCMYEEATRFTLSFSSDLYSRCLGLITNRIYGLPLTDNIVVSLVNVIALALSSIFIIVLVVELLRSGSTHFGQGRYLGFTFSVQKSCGYRTCAWILICFNLVLLADIGRIVYLCVNAGAYNSLLIFFEANLPVVSGLLYSAVSFLIPVKEPRVDYTSVAFCNLLFRRKFSSVLQDNNEFYAKVAHAQLDARYGLEEDLKQLTGDGVEYSTSTLVLHVCKPLLPALPGEEMSPLLASDQDKQCC